MAIRGDDDDEWDEYWTLRPPGWMSNYHTSADFEASVWTGEGFEFCHLKPHAEEEPEFEEVDAIVYVEPEGDSWWVRRWNRLLFLFSR